MMLDHVTIRSSELAATRAFFIDLFDLEEGPRPAEIKRIPGHWLYAKGEPIVHIIGNRGLRDMPDVASDAIDHVAFRLDDFVGFKQRLARLDIPHSDMELAELNERRVFLRAPGGPLIEAVFREARLA
jgi:catechol 2,3-dioxygenase-like lactoylglutathione lyase family enzyme